MFIHALWLFPSLLCPMGGVIDLASMPLDGLINKSIARLCKPQLIGFNLICKTDMHISALFSLHFLMLLLTNFIHASAFVPVHPIVSACGTATYNTDKFITKILQNYCCKTSSFVKDSTDFIKKIKHLSINSEEETLVSFDVSTLFTNIPIPVALQVINSKIFTYTNFTNVCKIPTEKFIKLLEFTISNCIFCFNKKFYK